MSITFDTWVWMEYLIGTTIGKTVKMKYVDTDNQIYTPSVCLMEVKATFIHKGKPFDEYIKFIEERSSIIDVDKEIALEAATLKSSEGLHSLDALVYACAKKVKTNLLSGDPHFKGKKDVEFLV